MEQVLSILGSIFFGLLIAGTIVVIIFDDGDSSKKIAWLLIITILPVVGLILYFMVGINVRNSFFFRKRRKMFQELFEARSNQKIRDHLFGSGKVGKVRKEYRNLVKLLASDCSTNVTDGNEIEIITSGQRKFQLLMEDLKNAKSFIHMEYFYFKQDNGSRQIKEMLMQKAREGVKVRFIHENIANYSISPWYYNEMKQAGVDVQKFTKPRWPLINLFTQLNYRDHRKIVIIDGEIGYTGGMNISDDYFIRWRDTHLRIVGNAVAGLQYSFMNTWITAGGDINPDFSVYFPATRKIENKPDESVGEEELITSVDTEGLAFENDIAKTPISSLDMRFRLSGKDKLIQIVPDEPESQFPIIHMGTIWAVQHAKKYIYMQTPYFVPPESMLNALKSAALSGVDVRIMIPAKADLFFMGPANRSYFKECLEAGVRIFERSGRFIHSKTFVSDDYLSEIGSANMDFRSYYIDYELNAYIYDETTARVNKAIFFKDLEACTEVTLEILAARPWWKKLGQRIIRLFAPLL